MRKPHAGADEIRTRHIHKTETRYKIMTETGTTATKEWFLTLTLEGSSGTLPLARERAYPLHVTEETSDLAYLLKRIGKEDKIKSLTLHSTEEEAKAEAERINKRAVKYLTRYGLYDSTTSFQLSPWLITE